VQPASARPRRPGSRRPLAPEFDTSITGCSQRYADQNERDHQELVNAIRAGRLEAREGV